MSIVRICSMHTVVLSPRSQCHNMSDSSPSSRCQPVGSAETPQSQNDDTCQHIPLKKNGPDRAWRLERHLLTKTWQTGKYRFKLRDTEMLLGMHYNIILLFWVTLSSAVWHLCSLHRCSRTTGGSSCLSQLLVVLTLAKAPHLWKWQNKILIKWKRKHKTWWDGIRFTWVLHCFGHDYKICNT